MTLMTDGREVDFGKKDFALHSKIESDGSVTVEAAFADGEYRSFTLPVWGEDKGLNAALSAYAAAGLEAPLKRFLNGGMSHDFDLALPLLPNGPDIRKPRASSGPKLSPLQRALVELTGKTAEAVVAWVDGKSRKERFALSRDARVAPILARYLAEEQAAKAAKKGETVDDLLADLGGEARHATLNSHLGDAVSE